MLELLLAKLVTGSNKGIIGKQNKVLFTVDVLRHYWLLDNNDYTSLRLQVSPVSPKFKMSVLLTESSTNVKVRVFFKFLSCWSFVKSRRV